MEHFCIYIPQINVHWQMEKNIPRYGTMLNKLNRQYFQRNVKKNKKKAEQVYSDICNLESKYPTSQPTVDLTCLLAETKKKGVYSQNFFTLHTVLQYEYIHSTYTRLHILWSSIFFPHDDRFLNHEPKRHIM